MQFGFKFFVFSLFLVSAVSAQTLTREQKLQKIDELNSQIKVLETDALLPDTKDLKQAATEGFEVFRLMPRERYDHKFTVQGGGAFYSFTNKSHDYQKTAQISLEQNYLSVGFAGADYGFISDLGATSLNNIDKETLEINFLVNYQPPRSEPEIRAEQRKSHDYETDGISYSRRVSAKLGHSYVLRAISFGDADTLVAFKIIRKDADGSLIIFWKLLENFETPQIKRATSFEQRQNQEKQSAAVDFETAQKVQNIMFQKGFSNVIVDSSTLPMTLRGTVPKGKLAEVMILAMENNGGKPVKNDLTEQ